MSDIQIRRAERADIEEIAEVVAESWAEAYREFISEEDMRLFTNRVWREELLKKRFDRNDPVFVILFLGTIKGVCSAQKYDNEDFPDTAEIDQLYLSSSAIGRGLGGSLLDVMLDGLRESGFKKAVLFVMEGNRRAIGFYEHLGFKSDGFYLVCENLSRKNHALRYIKEL